MSELKVKEWYAAKAEFDVYSVYGVIKETEKAVNLLVEEFSGGRAFLKSVWAPKSVILDEDWKTFPIIKPTYTDEGRFYWSYENNAPVICEYYLYV